MIKKYILKAISLVFFSLQLSFGATDMLHQITTNDTDVHMRIANVIRANLATAIGANLIKNGFVEFPKVFTSKYRTSNGLFILYESCNNTQTGKVYTDMPIVLYTPIGGFFMLTHKETTAADYATKDAISTTFRTTMAAAPYNWDITPVTTVQDIYVYDQRRYAIDPAATVKFNAMKMPDVYTTRKLYSINSVDIGGATISVPNNTAVNVYETVTSLFDTEDANNQAYFTAIKANVLLTAFSNWP